MTASAISKAAARCSRVTTASAATLPSIMDSATGDINFRGTMSFSIEKYAGVLLSSAGATQAVPATAKRRA